MCRIITCVQSRYKGKCNPLYCYGFIELTMTQNWNLDNLETAIHFGQQIRKQFHSSRDLDTKDTLLCIKCATSRLVFHYLWFMLPRIRSKYIIIQVKPISCRILKWNIGKRNKLYINVTLQC